MKLYTGPISLFSAKVRIALAEKELDFEHVSVGWSRDQRYLPHHPDVVALNPRHTVPVLVDGDTVLGDSTVILEYLEERYPSPPLLPGDPAVRARCRSFEAFADEVLFAPLWDRIEAVFYPAGPEKAATGEAARKQLLELEGEVDRALEGRDFLGGSYSFADIAVFVMVSAAATLGVAPDPAHGHLLAWLGRMAARPPVQQEMTGMQAFVAGLSTPSARAEAGT